MWGLNLRSVTLVAVAAVAANLVGCAKYPIRATGQFIQNNEVQSIAVLVGGRIYWPQIGVDPAIGLQASKQTLESVVPSIKSELETKGYHVVVDDVGIFPHPKYADRWVYPLNGDLQEMRARSKKRYAEQFESDGAKDGLAPGAEMLGAFAPIGTTKEAGTASYGNSNSMDAIPAANDFETWLKRKRSGLYKIKEGEAAYVYPEYSVDNTALLAAQTVFEFLDSNNVFPNVDAPTVPTNSEGDTADGGRIKLVVPVKGDVPGPPLESLVALKNKYGADLICFASVNGVRYSMGEKVFKYAFGVSVGLVTGVYYVPLIGDWTLMSFACYDGAGAPVWAAQYGLGSSTQLNSVYINALLTYFPNKGRTLDASCSPYEEDPTQSICPHIHAQFNEQD